MWGGAGGAFLKFLLNLLHYWVFLLLLFIFCFFGHEACGILAAGLGIEPPPSALEDRVLTTGPPEKFLPFSFDWTNRWTKNHNETAKAFHFTFVPSSAPGSVHNTICSVSRLFPLRLHLVMLQQSLEWKHHHSWFMIKINTICVSIY